MNDLEDLYREIILDHYRSPRNKGELPVPPAHRVMGLNSSCGDEIVLYIQVDGDTVTDIRISGHGCSISQSSASLMSAAVKNKSVSEVRKLIRTFKAMMSIHSANLGDRNTAPTDSDGDGPGAEPDADAELPVVDPDSLGELAALQGVVKFPARIKCATLSWNTLALGLDEASEGTGSST